MPKIIRSALVPYNTKQMFALVNNISAYAEFIPECTASRVIEQNGNELTAEINISKAGIHKTFITHNITVENQNILMKLVKGPFNFLIGNWHFIILSAKVSRIEFYLDFEFKNKPIEFIFGHFLKEIANNLVITFIKRAKEVYHV